MKIIDWWKSISKKQRIEVVVALLATVAFTIQVPSVYAWFTNRRQAARFERINSPNTLYITAAHREDVVNLVMDDINVSDKWIASDGTEYDMKYKDYVFSVAGERIDTFTLQLAHTTNNRYQYEIFLAERYTPQATDVEGRDYVSYKVTNEIAEDVPYEADSIATNTVLYYRPKLSAPKESGGLPITLNETVKTDDETSDQIETNVYNGITFNGHYLNGVDGETANRSIQSQSYDSYPDKYIEEHANALYWQCTNVPGGDNTTNSAFYVEFILRVYFNENPTAFKDTDIIYITASGT